MMTLNFYTSFSWEWNVVYDASQEQWLYTNFPLLVPKIQTEEKKKTELDDVTPSWMQLPPESGM